MSGARRLATIAKLSLVHGIRPDLSESLNPVFPKHLLSDTEKHEAAERAVRHMSDPTWSTRRWQRIAIRELRAANERYAAIEAARADISAKVLETVRSEALVELLRRDLDADPLLAEVAGAVDSGEIRAVMSK